ncbi:L domain-like protein [Acaromyces ingoldii]|uniref:L domain-like protein n=1 Tax=Acaromyces ingoldii TaxID=215250 RepID=A0A316YGL0_9BASI|nr:L domain-like protein [Acaromyces ingoldii]PWN88557.1 L domain-like protein [Acaromyces ingoldii]
MAGRGDRAADRGASSSQSRRRTSQSKGATGQRNGRVARKEPEVRDEEEEEEEDGDESMSEDSSEEDSEEEEDDILLRTSLDLSSKPLPPLEQLSSTLAKFKNLSSLNISAMQPSKAAGNPRGLVHLRWLGRAVKVAGEGGFGSRLTQLNMSENGSFGREEAKDEAGKWDGLQRLTKLMVLNASACELRHFPPAPILLPLTSLTALVLSNNALTSLPTLPHLPHLNTLILSKNRLRALPASLASSAPALKKLAASHNALDDAPTALPDLSACAHLRQVRLHCNPSLRRLPRHLSTWGRGVGQGARGTGIELLDLSECGLDGWASVEDALLNAPTAGTAGEEQGGRRERGLTNLSLKGNGLAELEDYRQRLLGHFRTLKILDNESVVERRKKKRRNGTSAAEEGRSDRDRVEDKRNDRARDEELEAKKKRAWDAIDEGLGASSSSAQSASTKTVEGQGDDEGNRGTRKRQVDASAVAGIVHVKKKRKQHEAGSDKAEARNSPAKTADPFAQVGLGLGGAWD